MAKTIYRQLQSSTAVGEDAYSSMADCFRKIIKNEGCATFPYTTERASH